jgi:hypothetical protein
LVGRNVLLVSVLLHFTLQTGATQTGPDRNPARSVGVVSVDAPLQEVLDGYLPWLERHPEAVPHSQPLIPGPTGAVAPRAQEAPVTPLVIMMPSIDLYSPSGVLIYHGTNSEKNVAFLRALPANIPSIGHANTSPVGPTLREAVEMFSELKPYEAALLITKHYTIFALTCPDSAHCKEQNEALQQLGGHLHEIGIGVIEVRLHK